MFNELFRDQIPESVGELKGRLWFGDSYCLGNSGEWVDPLEGMS